MLLKGVRRIASLIVAFPLLATPLLAQELSDGSRYISSPVLN
jgi:hypothetical protein